MLTGAVLTSAVAALHLVIAARGPTWYRFFGAGERLSRLAARGSAIPAVLTACIAGVLVIAALYACSAVGLLRPLPMLRPALVAIAAVFLLRGLLGIPWVLVSSGSYAAELRARMPFMVITSVLSCVLGICYAAGVAFMGTTAGAP